MITNKLFATGATLALLFAAVPQPALQAQSLKATLAAPQEIKPDNRSKALQKYLEAQNYEQAGNYSAAVAAYKEAIALDPNSAELRVAFGALYLKNRNVIDAETQAREAMKVEPTNLEGRKLLARIFISQSFVGSTFDKDKARAAIKELEEIAKSDQHAKIELGDKPIPVLGVIGDLYESLEEKDKAIEAFKKVSESDASADTAHIQLAQIYFQKNKFREAAAAARKAYDLNPKSIQYAGLLAKSLLRLGRTQEALDIYRKALNIKDPDKNGKPNKAPDDDDTEGLKSAMGISPLTFDYAEALVFAGKYDEAIKQVDPVLKLVRKDSPLYLAGIRIKVDASRRSGKREEAVKTLEEALKGQDVSESLPVLYSLAETYEEMQKFDKAVQTYEEALSAIVNPDGTVGNREEDKQNAGAVLTRIGLAYRTAGQRDKAMETFERMRKVLGADSPRADQLIIDTLLNEGKNQAALDAATAATKRFPDERSFKITRAQAASRLGNMQEVEASLRPLLKNTVEDADIYLAWASLQLEANQLKQAEETTRKAINLEPNDIGPLITLSLIQERQDKFKDAEASLRKALEIDPENATVLNNLGYYLAERGERLPEAISLIQRAVNIEPTNGSFMDSLGWVFFKQGKIPEAQKYLEQAVIYSPRSATIHDHLGDLYKKLGQLDKARAKWEDALKLATEPEEIKKIKAKLGKK
ncbi:MAG: tetratricopeptide repeat protein [Acidobacteria bacterium]|nr:tetratricopeptide repeat protein [Acidobacteriota bacterium]